MNEKKHHHSQAQEAPRQMPETPEEAIPAEEIAEEELPAEECAEQAAQPSPEDALKAALSEAQANAEDFKKKWYSVSAEYENYRKRTATTRSQAYAEGRKDVVVKLFPIADSLERALAACSDEKTRQGIGMVVKNFEKLLEGEKITVIAPVGEPFDANRCEAIMAVDPQEGEESGIVREVYAKGYEQDGKVLRFAQVLVTK
ncbi:MAG TPA: nucleotide exchange factor GrpE [Firmicutes bacterium]|nr:nucleotide exchange factor GrpE [Bacillota bacterium]